MNYKLGKLPRKIDQRTLHAANYLDPTNIGAPEVLDLTRGIGSWGMYLNDQIGDCLAEGTLVEAAGVRKAYKAAYRGPAIRLTFESGKDLTVTRNHAVLTPVGFRRAGELQEGDYCIRALGSKPFGGSDLNVNQSPAAIEEIVSAFFRSGATAGMRAKPVLVRPVDFHGDARFMDGNVDAVDAFGLLGGKADSTLRQPQRQRQIGDASELQRHFHRQRTALQRRDVGRAATLGGVRGRSEGPSFLNRHAGIAQTDALPQGARSFPILAQPLLEEAAANAVLAAQRIHGLASDIPREHVCIERSEATRPTVDGGLTHRNGMGAGLMASSDHPSLQGRPTDPDLARCLVKRFPGLVQADRLVKIDHLTLEGHVYDLSTESRFYGANGIVAHNCTMAAAAHMRMVWAQFTGQAAAPDSEADVVAAYEAVSGYDPTTGANDNGAAELDVLNYWRRTGIGGEKILAYAAVPVAQQAIVKAACFLGAGLYLGVSLPLAAQAQVGKLWDVTDPVSPDDQAGSWGGHAVNVVGYDSNANRFTVVTWGKTQELTETWWNAYVEEAYCIIPQEYEAWAGTGLAGILAEAAGL